MWWCQLCVESCLIGEEKEIFFEKYEKEANMETASVWQWMLFEKADQCRPCAELWWITQQAVLKCRLIGFLTIWKLVEARNIQNKQNVGNLDLSLPPSAVTALWFVCNYFDIKQYLLKSWLNRSNFFANFFAVPVHEAASPEAWMLTGPSSQPNMGVCSVYLWRVHTHVGLGRKERVKRWRGAASFVFTTYLHSPARATATPHPLYPQQMATRQLPSRHAHSFSA